MVNITNFYWFSFELNTNITFLLTNNHPSYQLFVKKFVVLCVMSNTLKINVMYIIFS